MIVIFRHGGFGIGEQQLGAVLDQAAIFLGGAGQKARHIDERDDRNLETIAEAHEAGRLAAGITVEDAGENERLIGDDADVRPSMRAKPVTMFFANRSWISKKSPSSTTLVMSSLMS